MDVTDLSVGLSGLTNSTDLTINALVIKITGAIEIPSNPHIKTRLGIKTDSSSYKQNK
jgi:hypothetical protein